VRALWAEGKGELKSEDYTKDDLYAALGETQLDCMFDTAANAMGRISLIRSDLVG